MAQAAVTELFVVEPVQALKRWLHITVGRRMMLSY
jgi:hypothetical protein